jgi:hypothetical protein
MAVEWQAHDISVLAAYSCAAVYVCSIRTSSVDTKLTLIIGLRLDRERRKSCCTIV